MDVGAWEAGKDTSNAIANPFGLSGHVAKSGARLSKSCVTAVINRLTGIISGYGKTGNLAAFIGFTFQQTEYGLGCRAGVEDLAG